MKRVRFSLRMMLLMIALIAVCAAWWCFRMDLRYSEWQMQTIDLKSRLAYEERRRAELVDQLSRPEVSNQMMAQVKYRLLAVDLGNVESEIAELHEKIEGTEPRH